MKQLFLFVTIIVCRVVVVSSQCNAVLMQDTSFEYIEQLSLTQETDQGYRTYMRRYYFTSSIDDARNGIYVQERDACFKLINEKMYLRNINFQGSIHPKNYLFLYPARNPEFFWIASGSACIKYNTVTSEYSTFKYDQAIDELNMNFIELESNRFCIMSRGSYLFFLDSAFHIQSKFRSLVMPINDFDSMNLFFKFEPLTLPLFANDSATSLSYLDGSTKWVFDFPDRTPYLEDWYSMNNCYYLVGSEDPDGNNVAYNPVIYKLNRQGVLEMRIFLQTNLFKAASATRCVVNNNYLYVAGYQTISRRPKELQQVFFAKLDSNLNLIWKKDLDLGCGPINSEFRNIIKSKDGGIIVPFVENRYGDTCEPILIKLDPDGRITSTIDKLNHLNSMELFPNPVQDILYLNSPDEFAVKSIRIYDITGKNYNVELQDKEINLSNLPAGMFILSIELSDHRKITKRIIKN